MPFRRRAYTDPLEEQPVKARPAETPSSIIDENQPEDSQFVPGSVGHGLYRQGNAQMMGSTPVGNAGVKQYHAFDPTMVFVLDDEPKAVPPPPVTQAVRRSIFQPLQQARHQFHINPAWGRHNGQYPRFSLINLIAQVAKGPDTSKTNFGEQGMRPRQRFTKVLDNPRNDVTPNTYGPDGGYGV